MSQTWDALRPVELCAGIGEVSRRDEDAGVWNANRRMRRFETGTAGEYLRDSWRAAGEVTRFDARAAA